MVIHEWSRGSQNYLNSSWIQSDGKSIKRLSSAGVASTPQAKIYHCFTYNTLITDSSSWLKINLLLLSNKTFQNILFPSILNN